MTETAQTGQLIAKRNRSYRQDFMRNRSFGRSHIALPLVTNNDRATAGLFSEMYKIEQLLKPLTDTMPESDNSTRGHGLAAETPTIRTLTTALLYCARTCTFLAGPTRVRPSPYPTPRGLDALPGPDSTGQTRKLPSLPHTGRGFRAPSSSHNQAPGDSEPWPWVIWEGTSSPKAQVRARMALQGGIESFAE
jgi:hypothetical protein